MSAIASPPFNVPSRYASSTDETLPPMRTRYFPFDIVPVLNIVIGDFFTIASLAIMPVAILENSINAIAGYFFIRLSVNDQQVHNDVRE